MAVMLMWVGREWRGGGGAGRPGGGKIICASSWCKISRARSQMHCRYVVCCSAL